MSASKKGDGFTPPNYTQIPNTLFELLPVMSNAELRVTLTLLRKTIGWHKARTELLSVPELADLAGLSESSAKTGIKEATARGTVKKFKARDAQNRPTYRYGVVISDSVTREEFERPRKTPEKTAQDDTQTDSSRQNLTGSEFDGVNAASGQILPGSPEDSSGQNLTGSYKEERNSDSVKEKEREVASLPALGEPSKSDLEEAGEEGTPPDGGAADAANPDQANPSQETSGHGERGNVNATSSENVPGGGAAAGETEAFLRRKLSSRFVDGLIDEVQPLGVDRRRDWFALSIERVKELLIEAVQTHDQHKVKVPTRLRDLLDEECRRKSTPVAAPAPLDEDGEIDMDALMRTAPLNGQARRTR